MAENERVVFVVLWYNYAMTYENLIDRVLDICCALLDLEVGWDFKEENEPNTYGVLASYVKNFNMILIDKDKIISEGQLVVAVAHEARHAWQWKNHYCTQEFEHYINAGGDFRKHLSQKIEVDANAFSQYFANVVYGTSVAFPKWYVPLVVHRLEDIQDELDKKAESLDI